MSRLRRRYGRASRRYAPGETIVLRAGTRVGMDRLRADTPAVIEQEQTSSTGEPFYGVRYTDRKGRPRTTWWTPEKT